MRSVRYGCRRTRSHSPAPNADGLSQIAFEMPSRPSPCTSPARRRVATSVSDMPSRRPASLAQVGHRRGMAEAIGRFQVDEARHRPERLVQLLGVDRDGQGRLRVDHRRPGVDVVQAGEDHLGLVADHPRQGRVELLPPPGACHLAGGLDAAHAVGHLDVARPAPKDGRPWARRFRRVPRPAVAVPLLVGAPDRLLHGVGQAELLGQRDGEGGVVVDHGVHLAASRQCELESDPEPVQRWVARPDHAHAGRNDADAGVVLVLDRFERDVVAEPLGLLVRVGVAADPDQQCGVVDDSAGLLVQADPLGQPQGDQALAQDVLHRLAEAEVDAQRERCDQLGQANRLAVCLGRHDRPILRFVAGST